VLEHLWLQVDSKYLATRENGARDGQCEISRPRSDVGNAHSRAEPKGPNDEIDRQPLLPIGIIELVSVLMAEHPFVLRHGIPSPLATCL
jgi:hypothetical protein